MAYLETSNPDALPKVPSQQQQQQNVEPPQIVDQFKCVATISGRNLIKKIFQNLPSNFNLFIFNSLSNFIFKPIS